MAAGQRMTADDVVARLLTEDHRDILLESLRFVVDELMEAEVSAQIGASYGERSDERTTHRNGYRERAWNTRAGELTLAIPKLRQGSYFPGFLEPRKRSEQALLAVIQEAYVNGVSTRKVDRLVESLGLAGIDKSAVSRICKALDEQVNVFRNRPLEGAYPYLWLDAKMEKVRDGGRVVQKALVIAYALHESGRREVIGIDVGEAETGAFWEAFLRSLVARGLTGVALAISDHHEGLKAAIAKIITGATWQRCTVHFLRNLLGHCRKEHQGMVAALVRPIFQAEGRDEAQLRLTEAIAATKSELPKIARLLEDAAEDLIAFYAFPAAHYAKLRSTNPLERVNREVTRRTDVVGIFPNDASLIRLAGSLLIEQNDEWLTGHRYVSEASMAELLAQLGHREQDNLESSKEAKQLQAA